MKNSFQTSGRSDNEACGRVHSKEACPVTPVEATHLKRPMSDVLHALWCVRKPTLDKISFQFLTLKVRMYQLCYHVPMPRSTSTRKLISSETYFDSVTLPSDPPDDDNPPVADAAAVAAASMLSCLSVFPADINRAAITTEGQWKKLQTIKYVFSRMVPARAYYSPVQDFPSFLHSLRKRYNTDKVDPALTAAVILCKDKTGKP